jgi:preprotein translocase subunit YajC
MSLVRNNEIRKDQINFEVEHKTTIIVKAQAAEEAGQQKASSINMLFGFLPYLAIAFAFYFLIIRPQNKKQNELKDKISKVKKDDKVLTAGGIIGTIEKVDESEVVLRVDEKTKITFTKTAIVEIISNVPKA